MFSTLASYIWGYDEEEVASTEAPNVEEVVSASNGERQSRVKTRATEDEWLLVDPSRSRSRSTAAAGVQPIGVPLENLMTTPSMPVPEAPELITAEAPTEAPSVPVTPVMNKKCLMASTRRQRKLSNPSVAALGRTNGADITVSRHGTSQGKQAARRDRICQPYARNSQRRS